MSLRCLIRCDFVFVLLLYICVCVCVCNLHIHWMMSHLLYAMPCGTWKLKTHNPVCQGAYNQIDKYFDHFGTISKLKKKNWVPPIFFFFFFGYVAWQFPDQGIEWKCGILITGLSGKSPQMDFKANILEPKRIFPYKNFTHLIVFKFSLPQMTECILYSAWVQYKLYLV